MIIDESPLVLVAMLLLGIFVCGWQIVTLTNARGHRDEAVAEILDESGAEATDYAVRFASLHQIVIAVIMLVVGGAMVVVALMSLLHT